MLSKNLNQKLILCGKRVVHYEGFGENVNAGMDFIPCF